MKEKYDECRVYFLMTMTSLFWGGAFIAGKIGVTQFPPLSLTFFRFLIATLIVFPIMVMFEKKEWKLKKQDLPIIFILGLVGIFGYHALFFTALKYTTAIDSSMIVATSPLVTSILASIIVGEKLGIKRLGAIGLALSGVLLSVSNGDISVLKNMSINVGNIIMLGAVLCQATYSVLSKKVMNRYSPMIITSYSFLVGTIILIPFVITDNPVTYITNVTWKGWLSVTYMAVFASAIAFLFQQTAIKNIGASKTMSFINLVPVFSIILSAIILKEKITMIKFFSALIIIAGVYLNSSINKKTKAEKIINNLTTREAI
ncbi:DMT family transporter [Wukongibacter baidiensis]|uniref:DMT family transporter n=1 Tax=Wukongibacter baidiensis TaxID=1723361 RepID=UPI003D7F68A4